MGITEELAGDQRITGEGQCKMCTWIEAQPDASEWDEALRKPRDVYTASSVHRLARKRGAILGVDVVKRHRRAGHRR
jgi:hypothetical protein